MYCDAIWTSHATATIEPCQSISRYASENMHGCDHPMFEFAIKHARIEHMLQRLKNDLMSFLGSPCGSMRVDGGCDAGDGALSPTTLVAGSGRLLDAGDGSVSPIAHTCTDFHDSSCSSRTACRLRSMVAVVLGACHNASLQNMNQCLLVA